ncbi:similar to Saccharomyces cerevisiae YDR239C Protein of unknown function that may interact with ribosomes, based on co-purification experiments [Maudiozyma saulgeensis]|uniref:Uncharacterized protein n=1 Tax=Maudiozyma saulgeensis TaxID=1789683 RepID=A0A1X7R6P2_9SACH|nr:similar to Saccharomyces cerevisiae YDR239C Protein of unknown function that may interact with ribosomes, based on co-purification experiments [Kazachstania saulgeensis]
MFSSGSGNKTKRKSFFLFGSDIKTTSKPHQPQTLSTTHTHHKKIEPASINESRTHSGSNHPSGITKSVSLSSKPTNNSINKTVHPRTASISTTPDVEPTGPIIKPRERVKRPPPPVVNMDEIRLSTERVRSTNIGNDATTIESPLSKTNEKRKDTRNLLSKDTMLNENHNSGISLIEEEVMPNTSENGNIYQHKRERSKAEELVDDIDIYLKSYKESSKSPGPYQIDPSENVIARDVEGNNEEFISEKSMIIHIPSNDTVDEVSPLDFNTNLKNIPKLYDSSDENTDDGADNTSFQRPMISDNALLNSVEKQDNFSFTGSRSVISSEGSSLPDQMSVSANIIDVASVNGYQRKNNNPFIANTESSPEITPPPLRIANTGPPSPVSSTSSDEYILNYGDESRNSRAVSTEQNVDLEPRRHFRVVNEDRPTFYAPADEDSDSSSFLSRTYSPDNPGSVPDIPETYSTPVESLTQQGSIVESMTGTSDSRMTSSIDLTSSEYQVPNNVHSLHTDLLGSRDGLESINNSSISKLPETPNSKSTRSESPVHDRTLKSEKPARLVSSYVEELRLKYYKTSNFLEAPPNLPASLKQKNNLIQPKNIRVAIRTSSKQVGIKHGRVKQKLLTLETNTDDNKSLGSSNIGAIDHTKEFHKLLGKEDTVPEEDENGTEEYLNEIPGDEAYDSEDCMAPLREKKNISKPSDVTRSNTTVSYYTKLQNRPRSGTVDKMKSYNYKLPTNILDEYNANQEKKNEANSTKRTASTKSYDSTAFMDSYLPDGGLYVANPESEEE